MCANSVARRLRDHMRRFLFRNNSRAVKSTTCHLTHVQSISWHIYYDIWANMFTMVSGPCGHQGCRLPRCKVVAPGWAVISYKHSLTRWGFFHAWLARDAYRVKGHKECFENNQAVCLACTPIYSSPRAHVLEESEKTNVSTEFPAVFRHVYCSNACADSAPCWASRAVKWLHAVAAYLWTKY